MYTHLKKTNMGKVYKKVFKILHHQGNAKDNQWFKKTSFIKKEK